MPPQPASGSYDSAMRCIAWFSRVRSGYLAVLGASLLAACGGGVSLGFGSGSGVGAGVGFTNTFDRTAPSIALTASATTVQAGRSVRLAAAAADESGIESVSFLRLDGETASVLATVGSPPYEIDLIAPQDGRALLNVFARATDNQGTRADSARIVIAVTP